MGDENVAEMYVVVVSEMAGADSVNCGRPLIEVIDEGEAADLSSDGIESFEDFFPLHHSPPSSRRMPLNRL